MSDINEILEDIIKDVKEFPNQSIVYHNIEEYADYSWMTGYNRAIYEVVRYLISLQEDFT